MLCNIPCRVTQDDLKKALDEKGFHDSYDFIYMPQSNTSSRQTVGYAFINLVCASQEGALRQAFEGFHFSGTASAKVCTVKTAAIQGFNENMENWRQRRRRGTPLVVPARIPEGHES